MRLYIRDIDTAVNVYYNAAELTNEDIMRLFNCSRSSALKLKKKAREEQEKQNKSTFSDYSVNTRAAFDAWNINIKDLEQRLIRKHNLQNKGVI